MIIISGESKATFLKFSTKREAIIHNLFKETASIFTLMEEKVEEQYLHIVAGFKSVPRFWSGDIGKEYAQNYVSRISRLGNINFKNVSDLSNVNEFTEKKPEAPLEAGVIGGSLEFITHPVYEAVYQVSLVIVGTDSYLNNCSVATFNADIITYQRISKVNRATLDVTVGFENSDDKSEELVSAYIATFFNRENSCNNSIRACYYECDEVDRGRIDATADGPIRAILKLQERLTSYVKPRDDSYFVNNSVVYYWQNGKATEEVQGQKKEAESDEESPRLHERYEAE